MHEHAMNSPARQAGSQVWPAKKAGAPRALFLDRDGVINEDTGYTHRIEDCRFVEGIFKICRRAKKNGFLLIVVTNQSGIAKGYYSERDFQIFMEHVRAEFKRQGCPLDDVFYCPFHEAGLPPYRQASPDRKPEPGMILKAAKKYGLDLQASILLGDKESDIMAGTRAGVKWNIRIDEPDAQEMVYQLLDK